jgi:hypothetical protein
VSDADPVAAKLAELVSQADRHRRAAQDYRAFGREVDLPGYLRMAENHDALFEIVCDLIRSHCGQHGLALPACVPERKLD